MKKVKKEKKPFIKTRTRIDNSIEVEFQKSPAKTFVGKILIWLIIAGTILVPLASLIYIMIEANK
ncbi:MAG: hypothetical protein WCT17_04850 [Bacilli bacterium]